MNFESKTQKGFFPHERQIFGCCCIT